MRIFIAILVFLVNIYADNFDYLKIKEVIKNEFLTEEIDITYLSDISNDNKRYVSLEFANASIYKFYILLEINNNGELLLTKYNFNPKGAYSFSVIYTDNIEIALISFLNTFIDEKDIHINNYEQDNKILFHSKEHEIELFKKKRIPISDFYVNSKKYVNDSYIEPIFDKSVNLKGFFIYKKLITEEDIMLQEFKKFIYKDKLNLNSLSLENKVNFLTLNQLLENAKTNQKLTIENINEVFKNEELNTKNLQKYNDIAYYLQQSNANDEAIFLLEKILEKFPNRTVAYLNLGDAYNGVRSKEKAKINYEKYISLMKQDGKESKIPQRVLEFK